MIIETLTEMFLQILNELTLWLLEAEDEDLHLH